MRVRKRALVVLLASLFLVAGLHPSLADAASRPWQIGIYEFPKCLEVQGVWYMQEVQAGYWHIWNANSGKCLNVQGASKADSAKIIQYTCQGISKYNDQWALIPTGRTGANGDLYFIQNRNSLKCLNAQGASSANGTDIIQYGCRWAWNTVFTWW